MKNPSEPDADRLHELDIELTAALYQAVGEGDGFEGLVKVLRVRHQATLADPDDALAGQAVQRQLDSIDRLLSDERITLSNDPLERAVEEVPTAALVLDSGRRLVVANTLGQEAFGLRPGERFDTEWIDPRYSHAFDRFVDGAKSGGNGRRMVLRLDTAQLEREGRTNTGSVAEALVIKTPYHDDAHIALRTLDIPWTDELDEQVAETFGLTEAESTIARQFFETRDIAKVAEIRGTSAGTVRVQLKTIFAKTDTSSQSDLLQLLSMLAARAAADLRSSLTAWSDPLGREEILTRGDGLRLAYTWQGASEGKPLLLVHGQSLGHILAQEADRVFRDAGYKVYVLSRPGFGHSEFAPKMRAMEDHAYAISEFCRIKELHGIPAMSVSSGLVGLVKAASDTPGLISSIVNVGYLWNRELQVTGKLPTNQRIIFSLAKNSPRLLEILVRIAYRNIRKFGVDWYIEKLLDGLPDAKAFYRSGQHRALIRDAAGHMLVQGPPVFVRELQQPLDPWISLMGELDIPVKFLLPEHDTIHDFASYSDAFPAAPNTTFEKLKGLGEIYFYEDGRRIADLAVKHFSSASAKIS